MNLFVYLHHYFKYTPTSKMLFNLKQHFLQNVSAQLKPDIGKHPLDCLHHLYDARFINYRAIQTPYKGVNDLAAGERLRRKFNCAPFIPHGRGLCCLFQHLQKIIA